VKEVKQEIKEYERSKTGNKGMWVDKNKQSKLIEKNKQTNVVKTDERKMEIFQNVAQSLNSCVAVMMKFVRVGELPCAVEISIRLPARKTDTPVS
jgi:hypothetical protein